VDYSEPNRRAYAAFLRGEYKTEDALRQAWDDPDATFARVTIPTRQECQSAEDGLFRRGGHGRRVADFERFHSEIIAETLGLMAAVAKRETGRKQICGGFYGYVTDLFVTSRCGHWALGRLLENPDIDFLTAPSSYGARELGTGYNGFMTALESVRLHGKLWFDENDYRTFLTPENSGYGRTDTRDETIAVQERELAQVIGQGSGMWWFDMVSGWFDDPELMAAIARHNAIAGKALAWDRESVAEVAVVLDEASTPFIHTRQNVGRALVTLQQVELGHMGAPFDTILLSDLGRARPYRLYIFSNAWNVTDERRAVIDRVVKTGGRTALWLYAPGYAGADGGLERMRALTGLTFRARPPTGSPVTVETVAATDGGLPAGIAWSLDELNPVACVDDPQAVVLGRIRETGEPGLALRRFAEWNSLHAAAGPAPAVVLRALARQAGVHIYCERDASLYVNRSFLALHSREAGSYTVRLPTPESRVDLLTGQDEGHGQLWSDTYPAATTRLWFRGTMAEWRRE
jgi:beta-galactosidase